MKSMIKFCMVMILYVSMNVLAQDDMSSMRSTFQQLNEKWAEAMVSGDLNAIGNFYTEDASHMPPNMPVIKGRDQIIEHNKKEREAGVKFVNFDFKTNDVFGTGNTLIEEGSYTLTFVPPNMTDQMKDQGKYVNVWQKGSDGTWKIRTEIWNSDTPETMTQAGAREKNMDNNSDIDKEKK